MLLFLALPGLIGGNFRALAQFAGIHREVYLNTDPAVTSLAAVTNHPGFLAGTPSQTNILSAFLETEQNRGDEYGQRLRGFILAPTTGNYTFWIASDELSQLFLSTDENPANKRLIATADPRSQSRVWTTHAGQQSTNIALQAGRRYYLEVLHKEGLLLDHLAVRWRLPNNAMEEPIPASRFVYEMRPIIVAGPTNLVVEEGRPAVFSVEMANFLPQRFQWQGDAIHIPDATNRNFVIPAAHLGDDGAVLEVEVRNNAGVTNSAQATLTVRPDTNAPVVMHIVSASPTNLIVTFSEPVATNSALNASNYSLAGASVNSVAFEGDGESVVLNTSPVSYNSTYRLELSNIFDRASSPNQLVATQIVFTASQFNAQAIGNSDGSVLAVNGGFDVVGRGSLSGNAADNVWFAWQLRSGDFDVQVRVQELNAQDIWTAAGLMARETSEESSRFAAILATPSLAGCFFHARTNTGWPAARSGAFPANWPNTWLRLKRMGNLFTGFASSDGESWTQCGSATLNLPSRIYLGLAVASGEPGQNATARFRDFSEATGSLSVSRMSDREPPGPSSRRTGLVITEIMYHPRDRLIGTNMAELEYVELFNSNPFYEDISGFRLTGDIAFTFPPGTILHGGGYLMVAKSPADIQTVHGLAEVFGPWTGSLPNDSGRVRLRNESGHVLLQVDYASNWPWPVAADGAGHSLVLGSPSQGENQREAWTASDQIGGSPGRFDSLGGEPLRDIVINEFLAHTDDPQLDFIELHNRGAREINLSGAFLTDSRATNKFRIPSGTKILPGGFVAFTENELGFALDATGERIFLVNSNQTRVIDALSFNGQANGVSSGRWPEGAATLQALSAPTPGLPNAPPRNAPVVINEIMYHPISENSDDEFLEIHNRSAAAIDLSGWRFTDGIDFSFPANTSISPGGYLVVARNRTNLLARYPGLAPHLVLGDYGGNLDNGGERVALAMPEPVIGTNAIGVLETNVAFVVVSEVDYKTGGQWGQWSDGGGSSLELIDARSDNRLGPNWADSDETAKAPWTLVEHTGVLDNAASGDPPDTLHVMLLEAGECLVDNVEAFRTGGGNVISNPGFESGLTGWIPRGNHVRSALENEGDNSTRSLRVRATSQGDISANRVRAALTSPFVLGQTATLRARARWLRGFPELLLRLRGNALEAGGRLTVPTNLGTPGAPNSRARSNAGPAIWDVTHSPATPAAQQPIVVTARVSDPDDIGSVALRYRIDPSPNLITLAMNDTGADGDATPGDGIFSAVIPGQPTDAVVAFVIDAADGAAMPATNRFPHTPADNSPQRECVVHFGGAMPASGFGTYRFWITQSTIAAWSNREVLSNERLFGTFVYDNHRVIYNVGGRYSGSPAHQDQAGPNISPVGSPYHFAFDMPGDDLLLGTDNFNKVHGAGNNTCDDDTLQREVTAYGMARRLGLAANYKRFVQFYVNGRRRCSLYEDTLVPGANVLDSVFDDDSEGDLFKLSIWYEFDQSNNQVLGSRGNGGATLNNFTTTGGAKKTARYRWTWQPRALNGTANAFTNVFALIDAANTATNLNGGRTFIANLEAHADMDQWMRTFALQHAVGNWDSFGFRNPQNTYAYKPTLDRWQLLIWDINIIFGGGTRGLPVGPVGDNLLEVSAADVPLTRVYNNARFLRSYWQSMQEIAEDLMEPTTVAAPLDARYAAFVTGGVAVNSPEALKTWIGLRRGYLLQQVALRDTPLFRISTSNDFTSATNIATISGVAPLGVKIIEINSVPWAVHWSSVTNWSLQVPLNAATNVFAFQGFDRAGIPSAQASGNVTVRYTGAPAAPVLVFINEWMAANTNTLADPADGDFEDWFELYNAGTNAVDLSGYFLTDVLTNKTKWAIPAGTVLAPGGFQLVWADEEQSQSGPDLHANFRLSQGGEELGLVAPDGRLIDSVVFGAQTNNISQGRWPDASTNLYFMAWPTPRASNIITSGPGPSLVRVHLLLGDQIEMTWRTVPDRRYQLEFKNALDAATWTPVDAPALATQNQIIVSASTSQHIQGYYRLVLLD